MKKMKTFAFAAAVLLTGILGFTACSSNEDVLNPNVIIDEDGNASVKPEFVISIPRTVINTRMTSDVTQASGTVAQFRGMDNIQLVPFTAQPEASTQKSSSVIKLSSISSLRMPGQINYKVYADQQVPVGTSNFLFYAKAVDNAAEEAITTVDDKFHFGVLKTAGLGDDFTTPGAVEMGLERINEATDAIAKNATGQAILALLNSVANTTGWETATNETLKDLYKAFITLKTCASAQVAVVLSDLYFSAAHVDMDDPDYNVSLAIRAAIEAGGKPVSKKPMELKDQYKDFPAVIGLPDGAARIAWNDNSKVFEDATAAYNDDFKNNLTQYAYPAALWYYSDTPIKASDEIESPEYDAEANWSSVIDNVYAKAGAVVTETTQSVALSKQAQYGVGRLELTIKLGEEGKTKYYDSWGEEVDLTKGFTLTGLLIGGQNSVGYDFTTKGNENLTIYDRDVPQGITALPATATATANHTLALETKADQVVNIALELVNNGPAFHGKDGGIIPAGGKFYIAARLDPKAAINYKAGELDKIFIQDHVTKLTVTIKNGKSKDDPDFPGKPDPEDPDPDAPDPDGPGGGDPTVPDLTSDSVELGTSVDLEWQEGLILTPEI